MEGKSSSRNAWYGVYAILILGIGLLVSGEASQGLGLMMAGCLLVALSPSKYRRPK